MMPTRASNAGTDNSVATPASITGQGEDMPDITEDIRQTARSAPNYWLGIVDTAWSGEGDPPDWAVIGRWRSDENGEIVEWARNPEYRASPEALGWAEPTDDVDAAVQLAASGYTSGDEVPIVLAGKEVGVLTRPDGAPIRAQTPDGTAVVPLFTSPQHLHAAGQFGFKIVKVSDLLREIPDGYFLYINPSGPVSMTVESDAVLKAIARFSADGSGQRTSDVAVGPAEEPDVPTVGGDLLPPSFLHGTSEPPDLVSDVIFGNEETVAPVISADSGAAALDISANTQPEEKRE